MDQLITGLVAIIVGVLSSIFAPYVKAKMDFQKDKSQYRKNKLEGWRREIGLINFTRGHVGDCKIYPEIRGYLSHHTREIIEKNIFEIVEGRSGDPFINAVLEDLAELEKKWKLL